MPEQWLLDEMVEESRLREVTPPPPNPSPPAATDLARYQSQDCARLQPPFPAATDLARNQKRGRARWLLPPLHAHPAGRSTRR